MFIQMMCVSDVRPEGEFIACGLGKLEPAPTRKVKDGFDDGCAMGQNQRLACIKVAAVKHDQGATLSGSARQVSAIDAALQPGTMKCNIVGTKPFKTPAKRSLTSLTVQGNSHLLDIICRFTAGTKKEALSRLF